MTPIQDQLSQLDSLLLNGAPQETFTLSVASVGYYFLCQICTDIYQKYRSMGIRITTSSRSVIYETLYSTDAYYLNSVYPFRQTAGNYPAHMNLRTLRVRDCAIQSEIAWIKRKDHTLSIVEEELVNRTLQYFS